MSEKFERPRQEFSKQEIAGSNISDKVLEMWRQEVPVKFSDLPGGEGEKTTREEIFKDFDDVVAEERGEDRQEEASETLTRIQESKGSQTNNFYLWFLPHKASNVLHGELDVHGLKPFYTDHAFNGAWARMCGEYPDDVKKVIESASEAMTVERNATLNKLALYLHNKESVPIMFLTR